MFPFSSRKCYDLLSKVAVVRRMLDFQIGFWAWEVPSISAAEKETGLLSPLQKGNYFNIILLGSTF